MESSTKILRRLLDEHGGFRVDFDREGARRTCWKIDDEQDGYCYFDEDSFGATQLTVTRATPEQAIAATLGSCNCPNNCTNGERTETCHEIEDEDTGFIVCSECGAVHDESYTACYCWCCGRRIEQ